MKVSSYKTFAFFQAADLSKPIDKRAYNKEDVPTCHDFNATTANADGVSLLVGLLGGQVQLIDPITKEVNKAYNAGEVSMVLFDCFLHLYIRFSYICGYVCCMLISI